MKLLILLLSILSVSAIAETAVEINPPAEGSVTREEGLAAWSRIYEVASHPRCSNCHVGSDNIPMWSGPSFGEPQKHGMHIDANITRIGAGKLMCMSCHFGSTSDTPHSAPGVDAIWQLAPVEAEWFGKSSDYICNQLRDPERNGDRTYLEIANHLDHDVILHWAWEPGGTREPAPYSLQSHVNDILTWGVAGMPCATDEIKKHE